MRCEAEKKFLASTKGDPAFISKGFAYWKEGPKAFKKHQGSDCHREAVDDLIVLPRCTKDVCELQSQLHAIAIITMRVESLNAQMLRLRVLSMFSSRLGSSCSFSPTLHQKRS